MPFLVPPELEQPALATPPAANGRSRRLPAWTDRPCVPHVGQYHYAYMTSPSLSLTTGFRLSRLTGNLVPALAFPGLILGLGLCVFGYAALAFAVLRWLVLLFL